MAPGCPTASEDTPLSSTFVFPKQHGVFILGNPKSRSFQQAKLQGRKRSEHPSDAVFVDEYQAVENWNPRCLATVILCTSSLSSGEREIDEVTPKDEIVSFGNTTLKTKEEYRQQNCDESPDGRIIGGRNARTGDAPFHVSLRNLAHERRHGFGTGLFCGGSLISERLVLTAAHCFTTKAANIGVVAGVLNRYDRSAPMQLRHAFRYLTHPHWNPKTLRADIGLLATSRPFVYENNVHSVPLAHRSPEEGWQQCIIFGWGRTREGRRRSTPVCLQRVDVTVVNLERCNRSVSAVINVPRGAFCAGSFQGDVDSCQGDSGGPLVCDGSGLF
uniref:Peptidase S1 domain-containing protein n=1 Tax=Anopheles atroparvus TaxID=41427 RepID=A0A182IQB2_ANOAO